MCGLVGYYTAAEATLNRNHLDIITALMQQAKIRGLHAHGFAIDGGDEVHKFHDLGDAIAKLWDLWPVYDLITHSRYSTSGDWEEIENNQPLAVEEYVLAFNGVISMATKEEMELAYGYHLDTYNDGEIFIRHLLAGGDPSDFVRGMRGSFAGLWYTPSGDLFALRNERRPLWMLRYDADTVFVTSTLDIFKRALPGHYEMAQQLQPNVVYNLRECVE